MDKAIHERLRDLVLRIGEHGTGALSVEEALLLVRLARVAVLWEETGSPEARALLVQAIAELRRLGAF